MILQLILSSGCPHKKLLSNSRGHGPNKFLHLQSNFLSGLPVLSHFSYTISLTMLTGEIVWTNPYLKRPVSFFTAVYYNCKHYTL